MKKILFIVVISSLITACNEGGAASPFEDTIELPKMPTVAEINATMVGADTDNDLIRDDLKIANYNEFPEKEDISSVRLYDRWAAVWTEMIINKDNIPKLETLYREEGLITRCLYRGHIKEGSNFKDYESYLLHERDDRMDLRDEITNKLSHYSYGILSENEVITYCNKFK